MRTLYLRNASTNLTLETAVTPSILTLDYQLLGKVCASVLKFKSEYVGISRQNRAYNFLCSLFSPETKAKSSETLLIGEPLV